MRPTWVQRPTDHPWPDHEKEGKYLQVPRHDGGALGVREVLGRQRPLNDHLADTKMTLLCKLLNKTTRPR